MDVRNIICINCPLGCPLTVTVESGQVTAVSGNTCKRGETYAVKEITAPARTVTSTVRLQGGALPVVSVRTKTDIPKEKIMDCMREINAVTLTAPVKIGDIAIPDVCGTGVPVLVTVNCEKETNT